MTATGDWRCPAVRDEPCPSVVKARPPARTHARPPARPPARTRARTQARTHARPHARTHSRLRFVVYNVVGGERQCCPFTAFDRLAWPAHQYRRDWLYMRVDSIRRTYSATREREVGSGVGNESIGVIVQIMMVKVCGIWFKPRFDHVSFDQMNRPTRDATGVMQLLWVSHNDEWKRNWLIVILWNEA